MLDICIIGAGASGLAAAAAAGRVDPDKQILIIEKKETPGKKLAATGNGKCNLTNRACPGADDILRFFESMGIYTRTDEEGRVYPYSGQAKDVVYALTQAAVNNGAEILTGYTVEKIEKTPEGFLIKTNKGDFRAAKLLIATGGKSAPQFGTSGDGYIFAKHLGHTVSRLAPVLTGIEVKEDIKQIRGVRVKALVRLLKDGKAVEAEAGEVQFNEDGISGICVMNLTRFIKLEDGEGFAEGISRYSVAIDFVPELETEQLVEMLKSRGLLRLEKPGDLLLSILPQQLRDYICSAEKNTEPEKLAEQLKGWELHVRGTKGWKQAQCTSGGVILDEVDADTMESRIHSGLYFAGEVIDYDGPCGGYNLQNAWETGIKAGKAMVNGL